MSNPRSRAVELRPDLDIPWSNRALMVGIFNVAAPLLLHPELHFEGGQGGQDVWQEHVESDAPTMVLMSHAEEADAVMMAGITQQSKALRQMRYETIVTAKRTLRDLPHIFGWIVRNGGTSPVDRVYESPNETPEQKQQRKQGNLHNRDIGGTVLRAGGNVLYFPEGGTGRRIELPDGNFEKVPREPDEMLPIQSGAGQVINDLPSATRDKLKIMTIVSRYAPKPVQPDGASALSRYVQMYKRLSSPTTHISLPAAPVTGGVEELRQQSEDLMAHGFERVIEIDQQQH